MAGCKFLQAVRLPGWREALADLFAERMSAPFVWGVNDCCMFAADAIQRATGQDRAQDVRGRYDSAITAARLIRSHGGLQALASARCGSEIPASLVQFGDIGLSSNSGRPCLAVFGGEYFHAPAEHGLTILPIEYCVKAWRLTD